MIFTAIGISDFDIRFSQSPTSAVPSVETTSQTDNPYPTALGHEMANASESAGWNHE